MRRLFVFVAALLTLPLATVGGVSAQSATSLATPVPGSQTAVLIKAINDYRMEHGLTAIPLSPEMTTVAKDHVQDLMKYAKTAPEYTGTDCVPHGWSSNGPWKGGCYKYSDPSTAPIMWNKPKEIAHYPGNGYEILYWSSGQATAADALKAWRQDAPHNDVIVNQGIWKNLTWRAMGVWVEDGYASVWFGEQTDPTPASAATGGQAANGGAPMAPPMNATSAANGGTPALPPMSAGGSPTVTSTAQATSTQMATEPPTSTMMPTEPPTMMPSEAPTESSTMPPTAEPTQ